MPISHKIQHFCMIVWKFRMAMRNLFRVFLLSYNQNCFLVHFVRLCEIFAWSCEMEILNLSTLFFHFFYFFLLNPPQSPSNQLQSLVQVHCFFLIIHIVLPSSKITLKYLKNFTKTNSIYCKGNNVLFGHIRHNYYSKGMEFMIIII